MKAREELLGAVGKPYEVRVERGKVVEFARAVNSADPRNVDPAAARAAGHPGVVAPPTFSAVTGHWAPPGSGPDLGLDLRRVLAGGNEWEYFAPLCAGDVLTVSTRVSDVLEKEGHRGRMTLVVLESEFRDRSDVVVLITRSTVIELADPEAEGAA